MAPGALPRFTLTPARLILALVVLGVLCRLFRYLMRFPIWGDEAYIIVNLLDRDFAGLTRRLDCCQVAPLLFLWIQKVVLLLLGSSELALRLVPLLAGLAGLFLLAYLARLTLDSLAATCAVGLFAVARWPVSLATVVKPYSFDLVAALVLLIPAVHFLRRPSSDPHRVRWLILLALVVPGALLASYPAVFVAGGVSLALVGAVGTSGSWRVRGWFLAYNAVLVATFLGVYLLVGREQQTGNVDTFMQNYWAHGFPPAGWSVVPWLLSIHSGRMMAYPVGDSNFGSILTFLLFLVGVVRFRHRPTFLVLCLAPFALNMLAAALHKYPYGGCCRLSQHLAPAVCLLAGGGLAWVYRRLGTTRAGALRAAVVFSALIGLLGVGEMLLDAACPYRDVETQWVAKVAQGVVQSAHPQDQIVVRQPYDTTEAMFRYHLGRHARVAWDGRIDWDRLERAGGQVWLVDLYLNDDGVEEEHPDPVLRLCGPGADWKAAARVKYLMQPEKKGHPVRTCEVSRWTRPGGEKRPSLPCRP
jgi:hypothetical protein